jgi:hypothetical protein
MESFEFVESRWWSKSIGLGARVEDADGLQSEGILRSGKTLHGSVSRRFRVLAGSSRPSPTCIHSAQHLEISRTVHKNKAVGYALAKPMTEDKLIMYTHELLIVSAEYEPAKMRTKYADSRDAGLARL